MSKPTALDLFSGAGGTAQGLKDAGYDVLAAVEYEANAAASFALNHRGTQLFDRDIRRVQAPALARHLAHRTGGRLDLLTACPPCQPFSTLGVRDPRDERNALVSTFARFVEHLRPRAIVLENVPGLRSNPRFKRLIAALEPGYDIAQHIVQSADYGIPQYRRRIVVVGIARDLGVAPPSDLLAALPRDFDVAPRTAGDAIALAAEIDPAVDPVHRARVPRQKTLERIQAIGPGGGRLDLPEHLQLACHVKLDRRDATSVYGRIHPDQPAPTMTTRCTTPSCGRFLHPTEHRGLTLREAALIQTFPAGYGFHGGHDSIERQIGNAVPPKLAEAIGMVIARLLNQAEGSGISAAAALAA